MFQIIIVIYTGIFCTAKMLSINKLQYNVHVCFATCFEPHATLHIIILLQFAATKYKF